ncbi:AraC family transcriptional regulator [Vibrio sinensis]|uniref:AraC family transcriptional regulator n=2 Tax=Vibrio sinensis TaxID=2302434 RepID=A0A3A6QWJ1_9VIBR|nr:AraC family transcriptional regulator [Vibrio sinensis]
MHFGRIVRDKISLEPFCLNRTVFVVMNGYNGQFIINDQSIKSVNRKLIILPAGTRLGCRLDKQNEQGNVEFITVDDGDLKVLSQKIKSLKEIDAKRVKNVGVEYLLVDDEQLIELFSAHAIVRESRLNSKQFSLYLRQSVFFMLETIYSGGFDITVLFKEICNESNKEKLTKMFMKDPTKHWTLDNTSKALFMSSSTLRRQLLRENTSFVKILNDVKLGIALNYLTFSNMSISKISELSGFNSCAYFCTTFKKKYHETPYSFRASSKSLNKGGKEL